MAETFDDPNAPKKHTPSGPKKVFFLFGEKDDSSPVLAAVRAGFTQLGLAHEFVAQSSTDPNQIEDELRENGIAGAIVPLSASQQLVSEAEYITENLNEIGSINVVTKDDFQDFHVQNTYVMALKALILANLPKSGEAKALVLGTTPIAKTAKNVLEELGITSITWNEDEAYTFDLATFDYSGISHIISGLSDFSPFPAIPEAALGPDTLIVDAHRGEKETHLTTIAKTAKSVLITSAELEFEATVSAFEIFVSPLGVPGAVKAPRGAMAKAFVDASTESIKSAIPALIAKHL